MPFDPQTPSAAKGHELATYIIDQVTTIADSSQLNADLITDLKILNAVLATVVEAVGS